MCGRLSQYRGIHDFVAVLSIPDALINPVGEQPLARYNAAPTDQLALLHLEDDGLRADKVRWGWRPHWAKDRAAPINARIEKVAHGPFFRAIWPHRAIVPIDNWFEWVDTPGTARQPWLIRRQDRAPILCAAIGRFPAHDTPPREDDGFVIITAGPWCSHRNWRANGSTAPRLPNGPNKWPCYKQSPARRSSGTGLPRRSVTSGTRVLNLSSHCHELISIARETIIFNNRAY